MHKLSILVPVYNESEYIIRSLENVISTKLKDWQKEIIIINDGSTDNTLDLITQFRKMHPSIKIISYQKNKGKGYALKKGIEIATGDVLIVQDADLEYDPLDYDRILAEYSKKQNVVYGSRILGASIYHNYNAGRKYLIGGMMLTKLANTFFKTKLTDQPTCYKSWRSNLNNGLLGYCKSDGFEFEIEMTAYFAKNGKIVEVPIHYYPRTVSHGKKIGYFDFLKSVFISLNCAFINKP